MPQSGEIRTSRELGVKGTHRYICITCPLCGVERWARLTPDGKPRNYRCQKCANRGIPKSKLHIAKFSRDNHYAWKGGRYKNKLGYVFLHIYSDNFFYSMASKANNSIAEHRLVMAQHLGRCLHSWEIVHHKNHIKDDNRIENLQLVSDDRHKQITILENKIAHLQNRVTLLEADNVALRKQVEETINNAIIR